MFPNQLEQIASRKAEIREELESPDADLDALAAEVDALEKREKTLRGVLGATGRPISAGFGTTPTDPTVLRSFGAGEDLRTGFQVPESPSLGAMVRGMATGDWSHVPVEQRSLISSGAAAAIPLASVLGIQEQAMAQSVVFQAGARGVNIDKPNEKVARIVSTGSAEWLPDAADRELSDQTIEITPEDLTAYSAWLFTEMSIETLEDAKGLDDAITAAFAQKLSLLYDQAAIGGQGGNSDMPLGVCNMTAADHGINEITNAGELVDHRPFIRAAGSVLSKHHRPTSVMIDTDCWTELAMLTDTTDQPIQPPKAYTDLREYVSDYLPSGKAVVADWSKYLFGTRTNITLEVSRVGDGFKRGFVQVRAYVRFGGMPVDPNAFAVISGIELPEEVSV